MPTRILEFLHFNDVYHLVEQSSEPRGGFARFYTEVKRRRNQQGTKPLILFSGDCFNPSIESSVTKGKHMIPPLNLLGIDVACYGNHDFDFGTPSLEKLAGATNFPWLLSNVLVPDAPKPTPLANGEIYRVFEVEGLRVGIMGLVEEEWLATISNLPPLQYRDFVEVAKELSSHLRSVERVDVIVALTHMRLQNDERLAREMEERIDLILGGHDHFVHYGQGLDQVVWKDGTVCEGGVMGPEAESTHRIIKSGCDFRHLSHIHLELTSRTPGVGGQEEEEGLSGWRRTSVRVESIPITSDIQPDGQADTLVHELTDGIQRSLSKTIGRTLTPWDARSGTVRTRESAIGNLAADIMRHYWPGVDIGLCCGGTIRGDTEHPSGPVSMRDILDLFPFEDPCVVIRVPGRLLRETLESAVSLVPRQEGRFPILSGARLIYDPSRAPGQRVVQVWFSGAHTHPPPPTFSEGTEDPREPRTNETPLEDDRIYTVCTRYYMASGHDGYEALSQGTPNQVEYVVDEEQGVLLSTMFRRFFLGLKYTNAIRFRIEGPHPGRDDIVLEAARKFQGLLVGKRGRRTVETALSSSGDDHEGGKVECGRLLQGLGIRKDRHQEIRESWSTVEPKVEGRIISLTGDPVQA
ncbi:MAG: Metallo-dependent phosphatase-like protein [Piptocephalis tieghemiana]|nr:MAG: Metallo-dependent phosphatase-like protein [Piptocephalis tieghemiana]